MTSMYILLCVCGLAAASPVLRYAPEDAELHFERFIQEHSKEYFDEQEKQARFEIFKENLEKINRMNEKSESANFGITKFSDLTTEEFLARYTGLRIPDSDFEQTCTVVIDADVYYRDAPESFDWREHNVITRIKNQGGCGSCYAFSTTGNIESQYAIKHAQLIEVSEQQIVDCDKRNFGCGGGLMSRAFRSIIEQGGIEGETDYRYKGKVGDCQFDASKVKVKLANCLSFNVTSQEFVKQVLYKKGPISIGVQAEALMNRHSHSIISDDECDVGMINHAVLLVGYGTENGKPFWIVKNSWGTDWGTQGYFRMARGEGARSCGMMNEYMSSSVLE